MLKHTDTDGTNHYDVHVLVRTPCTCGAKRWFACRCAKDIAEYTAHGYRPMVPDDRNLAWLRAEHPGATLIY